MFVAKIGAFNPTKGETVDVSCISPESNNEIFDRRGTRIRRLSSNGGTLSWDGRNDAGEIVAAGVYSSKCTGGKDEKQKKIKKVVVIK
jgi:flagellar hook assembly protein FlgD